MKTTITINGLPVEFSDTKPTRPGAYWNAMKDENSASVVCVCATPNGTLYIPEEGIPSEFAGLWSSPLVPVTEVDRAWDDSRARRVVEGDNLEQ